MLHAITHLWRRLGRPGNRGYALAAVVTLAIGIAAVIAVYSLMHRALLAPLPITDESSVVRLAGRNLARAVDGFAVSYPDYQSWSESARSYSGMAALKRQGVSLRLADGVERADAALATPSLWQLLGVQPVLGRAPTDSVEDRAATVLISQSLWRERFGADAQVLGRPLVVEGRERRVIGVLPDDVGIARGVGVWLPLDLPPDEANRRGDRRLDVLARLAPGVTVAQAQAELAGIGAELARAFPDSNAGWDGSVQPVREWLVGGDERMRLWTLLGAVALLLLVTCSNLAGLQLARAADRRHDLAVRLALGASGRHMRREVIVETVWLVTIGVLLALPLAAALLRVASQSMAASLGGSGALVIDPVVAASAIAVCALTAIAFAGLPAASINQSTPKAALGGGRNALGRRSAPLRSALVVLQFAIATVLLTGALALGHHLLTLTRTDLGYGTEHILSARIGLPAIDSEEALAVQQRALAELAMGARQLPGVRQATVASEIPLGYVDTQMEVAPGPMPVELAPPENRLQSSWRIIDAGYFDTFGIRLIAGRAFARDNEPGNSIILSRAVAERVFGSTDVVGRQVTLGNDQGRQVVGVVEDTHQRSVAGGASPTVYLPTSWYVWETMTLVVRTEGDPAAATTAIRVLAGRVFPERPLYEIQTMRELVSASTAGARLQTVVITLFALAAVLIAVVGIAAITAYLVARRGPELALRLALGSTGARIGRDVLRGAGALALAGLVLGGGVVLTIAWLGGLGTISTGQLSVALLPGSATLLLACFLACWWPARRAARIAPASVLRGD